MFSFRHLLLFVSCSFIISFSYSQTYSVRGKLTSSSDNKPLVAASVTITNLSDSSKVSGGSTDEKGYFKFTDLPPAKYRLNAFYMGHKTYRQIFYISGRNVNLKEIKLEYNPIILKDVTVESNDLRTRQKGDTTIYNARAFKTNPDANTEDLIKKMPGVVVQDNKVQAHGEDLKKVLVDGQEFFGNDPAIALKNLPAEVVDKVQIFDKMSDQAQFTGFNDGNTDKTINIITKNGKNNGQFGKIYAGYGTDDRYLAGGSVNFFNGSQRISLIGLSNNINQQNFSHDDIMGVLGTTSQRRGGGPMPPPGGGPPRGSRQGPRGGGFGSAGNFLVGQQNGINATHSYGLNYINKWSDKATLNASYFFNNSQNNTVSRINRQYFLSDTSNQLYNENYNSSNDNFNHRFNARLEYKIDSMNSFIYTPSLSFQKNRSSSAFDSRNFSSGADILKTLNDNNSRNSSSGNGWNISNNILLRHKFAKSGRTISLNLGNSFNEKKSTAYQYSVYDYYSQADTTEVVKDQQVIRNSESTGYSASLIYTEPIGKKANLQFSYSPSLILSNSGKLNYLPDHTPGEFSVIDDSLSNKYDFTLTKQSGGVNYRLRSDKYNFMAGFNLQQQNLEGEQKFPSPYKTDRTFNSFLPIASFMFNFSKTKNLRIFFRTSTRTPDISQLQDVIDNSNPLLLSSGNSKLKQDYTNNLSFHYHSHNQEKATSFFMMFFAEYSNGRITNSTIIPSEDTLINNYLINKGTQLSMPVNSDGYRNVNSFFTYGFPLKFIKCNLNLNGGVTYSYSPSLINNSENISETYTARGGALIGSNISENIDFNLSYNMNYYFVNNTINTNSDNNYFNQVVSARMMLLPWKGLVLSSDLSYNKYSGLLGSYNQELLLWNAGIGYKFLKNKLAEIRLSVSDILDQNKSINRTVTETYIEDNETEVLNRYFILTFTYNIKNFYSKK